MERWSNSTNNVLSHEVFESITDPDLNAWYYVNTSGENGDLCNFNIQNPIALNGIRYAIQREYDNATHGCAAGVGTRPSNDSFGSSIAISEGQTLAGTNVGATLEFGEPFHGFVPDGASVWWSFTAPRSGRVTINTLTSNFDTTLGVYTGSSVSALTPVAGNDDCASAQSCVTIDVLGGTVYRIAVDGYYGGRGSSIVLSVSRVRPIARDFNADDVSDVLWRDTSGNIALWLMNGGVIGSSLSLGNVPTSWSIVGQRDFNGDGKADILWRNTSGATVIWLMNGGTFVSSVSLGTVTTDWSVVGIDDFNGDGKADILWRNTSGALALWLMNGTTFVSNVPVGTVTTDWSVAGTSDFNGDGKADILWRNTSGATTIWFMNGGTLVSSAGLGTIASGWSVAGTGD